MSKAIPGTRGAYWATGDGRIVSARTGFALRPTTNNRGYLALNLGRRRRAYVHRLICEAWWGPEPIGEMIVMHLDADKTNNRPENLAWGSQETNERAKRHPDEVRHEVTERRAMQNQHRETYVPCTQWGF